MSILEVILIKNSNPFEDFVCISFILKVIELEFTRTQTLQKYFELTYIQDLITEIILFNPIMSFRSVVVIMCA